MYTPRFNPNSAVSNWKSRLDFLKGYPGAQMMGALNGGFLGGAPVEFSGGSSSVVGDYTYVTYASSGTVTCVSGGEIDVLLVGAGGGNGASTGQNTGGGGGGGALAGATVTVEPGTYTLTIGAAPVLNTGDPGGDSHILMAGWNLYACGGGNGGYGGYANCTAGGSGRSVGSVTPYQRAGGAGGGGGVWYGYCTGGPGYGQDTVDSGTGSGGGTWSNHQAGNGWGSFNSYNNVGGGGGGAGGNTANSVDGQPGYTWLDGTVYGSGGDGGGGNTPVDDNYGSGTSYNTSGSGPQAANNGVLIVRYLTDG
jgi:hypothetical protein